MMGLDATRERGMSALREGGCYHRSRYTPPS
jgi:hypothetical protein